ncbi:MAG: hypothetical protein R3C68_07935 [Myxococcota bacterium]
MADDSIDIYFAFPDGAMTYDCATCDQRCCKTGSLAIFANERQKLINRHPALELVAPTQTSGIELFSTPITGCWFLENNQCRLLSSTDWQHNRHHSPERPSACTLFPFNLFGSLGKTLVVAPNALCPLGIAPGEGVRHTDISELLRRLGAAGAPPQQLAHHAAGQNILERLIRDAASASLQEESPLPLLAFQSLLTKAFVDKGIDGLEDLPLDILGETIESYHQGLLQFCELIGTALPNKNTLAQIAAPIAAWTPMIRLFGLDHVALEQIPRALLGLVGYVAHWVSLNPSRILLPQTIMQILSTQRSVLGLWAAWEKPWPGASDKTLGLTRDVAPQHSIELPADPILRNTLLRQAAHLHAQSHSLTATT